MRITPEEYIRKKGWPFETITRNGEAEAVLVCPFCGGGERREKCFGIGLRTGAWSCLRKNNCGRTGTFRQLMEHHGDAAPYEAVRPAVRPTYKRPPALALSDPSDEAQKYLLSRKLKPETWQAWGVRFRSGDHPALVFEYWKAGIVVNRKFRHRDGDRPWKNFSSEKDAEPTLWGLDQVKGDVLIITEGELDAMSFWQCGLKNVVSVPMGAENLKWIEVEWERLKRFKSIFLAFDEDEAGAKGREAAARRLGLWRCFLVRLPQKDANQCLMLGVPSSEIEAAVQNAGDFKPPILVSASVFEEAVAGYMGQGEACEAPKSGFKRLDQMLRGFRPGELTLWTGRNGSGKSTLLFQVGGQMLYGDVAKVCFGSFEMVPKAFLWWMVRQALHEKAKEALLRKNLFSFWDGRLYVLDHQGEIGPELVVSALEYAARRYGVTQFFLDSLMMVKVPFREKFDAQVDFERRLKELAMGEGVHIHLVAHPRKGEKDTQEPDKTAVRGASELTDIADNVVAIHRESDGSTKLTLHKNRIHGELAWMKLVFHPDWKLFRDAEARSWADWWGMDHPKKEA